MTLPFAAALLAHEGGWDEWLLVIGPIVGIAGLLLLAKRRVERAADDDADVSDSSSSV